MIKRLLKRNLPAPFLHAVRSYKNREYNNLSTEQIFTKIYEGGVWGKSNDPLNPFYSGSGSRSDDEVAAYLQSVPFYVPLQSNPTSSTSDVAISL